MFVADIMTKKPVTIHQDADICTALDEMARLHCHHLPVTGREGHLIGILSDHDCLRVMSCRNREELKDHDHVCFSVRNAMTPAPIVIEPTAPIQEAARLMITNHIRCLPVMRSETLVGIVTTSDLLIAFLNLAK